MKKILIVAPHPDDEILGCGGTIIKNIREGNEVYVCIVTKGCSPLFDEESVNTVRRECIECHKKIGVKKTIFLDYPASMLEETHRYELNDSILEVIKTVLPEEIYIPHCGDMQKDHQIVSEACMVALRPKYPFMPKRIYSYETLSETGWNIPNTQNDFVPNCFVDISNDLEEKINAFKYYRSQISLFPNARSVEAIEALAKYRGATMSIRAAEAFEVIREII